MIEGAHIDKQSHQMDADRVAGEVLELDRTVGVAKAWADKLGDNTVLLMADHETSGIRLISGLTGGQTNLSTLNSNHARPKSPAVPASACATNGNVVVNLVVCPLAPQGVVGTYDAVGFSIYSVKFDGYPDTMDIDHELWSRSAVTADIVDGEAWADPSRAGRRPRTTVLTPTRQG
jgi:alkaline phosphatase